jgi:hypothetical protein
MHVRSRPSAVPLYGALLAQWGATDAAERPGR